MPIELTSYITEASLGAVAQTYTEDFKPSSPVSALIVTLHFLQNGATLPTIAHVLAQFGSEMRVKRDGSEIFRANPSDLHYWQALAMRTVMGAHISDGTGADDHVMTYSVMVPFGRWSRGLCVDKEYGLRPPDVSLDFELVIPADANNIDTRVISVVGVEITDAAPAAYIARLVKTATPAGTGWDTYINLPYGAPYSLAGLFFFQTTGFVAGTTTDTTTIEAFRLEKNEKVAELEVDPFDALVRLHGNLSAAATSPLIGDLYAYLNLLQHRDPTLAIPLDAPSRLNFNAGDTNALRVIPEVITAY